MDEALEKMTKLANELCDKLETAEVENKSLKEQLAQVKTASAAPVEKAPVVSAEAVQNTCDALVKAGHLTAEQVKTASEAFFKDPDAPHRLLVEILNAPAQEKKASESEDVSGGTLAGAPKKTDEDPFSLVYKILDL